MVQATSQQEFSDADFRVVDNADQSRKLAFQVSGVTTATTRTLTVPNLDGTIRLNAGTTTNDNAAAGDIGEVLSGSASGVAMTTATAKTIASLALTAGDWDVDVTISCTGTLATGLEQMLASLSATNNTLNTAIGFLAALNSAAYDLGNEVQVLNVRNRVSIASTTTYYAVGRASFAGGTIAGAASIRARRAR
jgi:hypothetical protein